MLLHIHVTKGRAGALQCPFHMLTLSFNNILCVHVASQASAPPRRPSRSPQKAQPHTSASPSPATAATAVDAAGRAAAELAEFQDRQMGSGDDIDPDAPAAMKDSPSVSGDDKTGESHHHS